MADKSPVSKRDCFYTDVRGCARCGGEHKHVLFEALANAPPDCTHYGMCHTTGQPILMVKTQDNK